MMKRVLVSVAVVAAFASSSYAVTATDRKVMQKLGVGSSSEVDLAKIVEPKATNADVKAFARRMIDDHSKGFEKLQHLARIEKTELKGGMDAEHKRFASKLAREKHGLPYDRTYMNDMVKDHEKDLKDAAKARKQVKNLELAILIDDEIAMVKGHLQLAKEIRAKLK